MGRGLKLLLVIFLIVYLYVALVLLKTDELALSPRVELAEQVNTVESIVSDPDILSEFNSNSNVDVCTTNGNVPIIGISWKQWCQISCVQCALFREACDNGAAREWYSEHLLWCLNPSNSVLLS